MTEAVHPTYVHEITTLRGKVLETHRITAGDEPVVVYQRYFGFGTRQRLQITPAGELDSIVLFGNEVLEDKTRNSIGSSRRFFLDRLRPRFEIVRPA